MACELKTSRRHFVRMLLGGMAGSMLGGARLSAAVAKRPLPNVDLAFLDSRVSLFRRPVWTAALPGTWQMREAGGFSRITIHHQGAGTASSRHVNAVAADIDAIFGGHRRLGYADIGYHFVIDYDGRVWEARSLRYEGAHVSDQNEHNLGVLLLGNFERQEPSAGALTSLRNMTSVLCGQYDIKPDCIYGHRDLGASVCPGIKLYTHLTTLHSPVGGAS